jgi:hypothetical protein
MCNHTDTNEALVVYKSLSFGGYHARPYSEWYDLINYNIFGEYVCRFEQI